MGTFSTLRDNSKKVIWAFLIVFILSMVAGGILSGGFSIVPQIKTLVGIDTPERNSLNIDGKLIRHGEYINIFSGFQSSNSLISTAPLFAYYRHNETLDELKGIKAINDIYSDIFESDLSEIDKLFYLSKNLTTAPTSSSKIYPLTYPYINFGATPPVVHSINKIKGSISRTYFESFSEPFEDDFNGIYDIGEDFEDFNLNNQWDEGEPFTDGNKKWDTGESFTDIGNGTWDEGEDFTDSNENGTWDEGEIFTDVGNDSWDNGQDAWIENSFKLGGIDYNSINSNNQSQAINSYINNVATYDAKYEKLESAFDALNFTSDVENKENLLLDSSTATIHYIEYDLNNISEEDINSIVTNEKINSKVKKYQKLSSGFSIYTLLILCLLLALFMYQNRLQKAKIATGGVFLSLLFLILVFKAMNESSQGQDDFKEISYIYISKLNGETYTDKANGVYDIGTDQDCGLDGICKGDENYTAPDVDNTENNNILDYELFTDANNNGIWDEGEDFTDSNGNGIYDLEEKYADLPNGIWDEGEDFTDSNGNGIWDDGVSLTESELNRIKVLIDTDGFKTAYDNYDGLKLDNVLISKVFNAENKILTQTTVSSMIFDIINNSFESDINDYFVIANNDNNDNLNGYLIGYVESEGNYHKKVQTIEIKKNLDKEARQNLVLNQNIFKTAITNSLGEEDIDMKSVFSNNEILDQLENLSNEGFKVVRDFKLNNLNGIGNDNSPNIKGTLIQMSEGEASDIVFSNDKAYIIYMKNKEEYNGEGKGAESENLAYKFSDYFNDKKTELRVNDWRSKASRAVADESGYTNNINDIYFNFGNFKATFGFR